MPKKPREPSTESSLSPPPDDLAIPTQPITSKRKADTTTIVIANKRTKKSTDREIKTQETTTVTKQVSADKSKVTKKVKVEKTVQDEATVEQNGANEVKTKTKTPRKKKEVNLAPLQDRTTDTVLRIGAHVSIAGGIHNAIGNVLHIGANAFALFMKNQRKWENPELDPEYANLFVEGCKKHGIEVGDCCVPHGSYLVNLAHPDAERKKQAYDSFHNDLVRCVKLGIKLYNFHPGNANATSRDEGIRLIAENNNDDDFTGFSDPDDPDDELPDFFKQMRDQGKKVNGANRKKKGRVSELVREKVRKVLEDDTQLAEKRARLCDEGDFLKLLYAFNQEGIHFS